MAVAELILYTDGMRKLITKGFPLDEVRVEAKAQHMITLKQDGLLKALEGFTTIEEVLRISTE